MTEAHFYIGCPMWGYKAWVGDFFPDKTPASQFLHLYSRKLTTVEGNTTFYALPSTETIARWRQETPPSFRFCPKVTRDISHTLPLDTQQNATHEFIQRMQGLGERLGPIFLQLPPSFAPGHIEQLEHFLAFWPRDVRLAVEIRHLDFFREPHAHQIDTLLKRYNVARVVMDTRPIRTGSANEQQMLQARERKPNVPVHIAESADFAFIRYIGHPRMEVNAPFLEQWAQQMGTWLRQGLTVYAFCHCPFEEHSPAICCELYQRIREWAQLPSLPWENAQMEDEQPTQGRLF
ncbi:DUF72 domain-containing protein [Ktedonospora formicarum]|uniref:DUF72 domain-containing protein n=1 Tax=Ktedonospora formicarum TaxID=2778364 RepID=A0A8J3HVT8_9CHLR|nr:DUF72 domain-containing protein [Ktedonospora formicarum]GHO42931.1 hypothetical protein KSX_10940 [Ktedonospora formicarum]